jgi:hypothetical protein
MAAATLVGHELGGLPIHSLIRALCGPETGVFDRPDREMFFDFRRGG